MTASGSGEAAPAASPDEDAVVAWLQQHPGILDARPELFGVLSVTHPSGDAASLLERQVSVLREENRKLRQQFDQLVSNARENETLNARIHRLALALIDAAGPQAIFDCLRTQLCDGFGADRVHVRICAEPAFVDAAEVPEFVGGDSDAARAFGAVLDDGTAVCGPLAGDAREALGETREPSAAVLPLVGRNWRGVLVIASDDPGRYQYGMATDFLTYLRDVATLVIDPWVKR